MSADSTQLKRLANSLRLHEGALPVLSLALNSVSFLRGLDSVLAGPLKFDVRSFSLCCAAVPPRNSLKHFPILLTICWFACAVGMTLAQDCSTQRASLANAEAKVKQDVNSIRMLKAGITSQDLEDAVNQSEEGRKQAILGAISALLDGALSTPDAALNTNSISGYRLKNGLGSIGTGQATKLIGMIRNESGAKQALIPVLRSLSQMSGKTETLEYLDLLSRAASSLKSTAELGAPGNTLEESEALFGLAAAIVGRGDIAVSVASSIVNTSYAQTEIYLLSKSINQLTSLNESQLQSLRILSAKLNRDVQDLKTARNNPCQAGPKDDAEAIVGAWMITMQTETGYSWKDTIVVRKVAPAKFDVSFGVYPSADACAFPLLISQTGPSTYSGTNTIHDQSCYDNSSDFEVEGNKISIRSRITQSNHQGSPSNYRGSGVRK